MEQINIAACHSEGTFFLATEDSLAGHGIPLSAANYVAIRREMPI